MDTAEEAAAGQAVLTGQVRSFMSWLGAGRKLTAAGRIGLADARQLVELLGTGDEIDREIGGRVFKTRSSQDLPYLARVVEWMKAAAHPGHRRPARAGEEERRAGGQAVRLGNGTAGGLSAARPGTISARRLAAFGGRR